MTAITEHVEGTSITEDAAAGREGEGPRHTAAAAAEETAEVVNSTAIVRTTALCVLFGLAGHAALMWIRLHNAVAQREGHPDRALPTDWQPLVAMSVTAVSLIAFGGFYLATRRARIAIASTFILTFLSLLPFALTIPTLNADGDVAKSLVQQFSWVVGTVVIFYFGSEAAISASKIFAIAKTPEVSSAVRAADRDLAAVTGMARSTTGRATGT